MPLYTENTIFILLTYHKYFFNFTMAAKKKVQRFRTRQKTRNIFPYLEKRAEIRSRKCWERNVMNAKVHRMSTFLKGFILWYAMLWYDMKCMVYFEISMLWNEILMLCYGLCCKIYAYRNCNYCLLFHLIRRFPI